MTNISLTYSIVYVNLIWGKINTTERHGEVNMPWEFCCNCVLLRLFHLMEPSETEFEILPIYLKFMFIILFPLAGANFGEQ